MTDDEADDDEMMDDEEMTKRRHKTEKSCDRLDRKSSTHTHEYHMLFPLAF